MVFVSVNISGGRMSITADGFYNYIITFFGAWVIGVVIGLVGAWFRSLLGAGD
jgi:NhaP-type Na+/H+ or K+/H+ antiporter